jgi:hypothetical protein
MVMTDVHAAAFSRESAAAADACNHACVGSRIAPAAATRALARTAMVAKVGGVFGLRDTLT